LNVELQGAFYFFAKKRKKAIKGQEESLKQRDKALNRVQ
jgi:hypothetical protein